jgi:Trk-type K+ transport system membrane component
MMYISVFPVAISIRGTNVYEEESLGIYAPAGDEEGGTSFLGMSSLLHGRAKH